MPFEYRVRSMEIIAARDLDVTSAIDSAMASLSAGSV